MNKPKTFLGVALLSLLAAGIYNLIVFFCFKNYNSVFWWSYGFTMAAFVLQLTTTLLAFRSFTAEATFFGIPVASFSLFYLGIQVIVSLILMAASGFVGLKWALFIQLIILLVFLFAVVAALLTRNTAVDISNHYQAQVFNLRSTLVEVETFAENCDDAETKKALMVLAEKIRYSDPMMVPAVEDVNRNIQGKLTELRNQLDAGDYDNGRKSCQALERLYAERNRKLAISK